jgi:ATP-dependent Clp protease ATP-binding subunit ClpA
VGSEHGSPLNNFLVSMSGQKSIVFLDEFEKTGPEVLNALLIPFDEGTLPRERSSQFPEQGLTPRRTLHRQTQASRTLSFLLSAANLLSRERSQAHIVDCSKTIWILATNALDKKIKSFCEKHEREIFGTEDHQKIKKTVKALQKSLKSDLGEKFGVSRRINNPIS